MEGVRGPGRKKSSAKKLTARDCNQGSKEGFKQLIRIERRV